MTVITVEVHLTFSEALYDSHNGRGAPFFFGGIIGIVGII